MTGSWRRCDPEWTQMRMFGFVVFVNGFVILNELHSKAFFFPGAKSSTLVCIFFLFSFAQFFCSELFRFLGYLLTVKFYYNFLWFFSQLHIKVRWTCTVLFPRKVAFRTDLYCKTRSTLCLAHSFFFLFVHKSSLTKNDNIFVFFLLFVV